MNISVHTDDASAPMPVPARISPETTVVVALTLLGAIFRLHRLDAAELWSDEMTGVIWSDWSIPQYLHMMRTGIWLHFPLPIWVLKAFIGLFGQEVFVYRLLGFVPGVLSIPALYVLGRSLFSVETGLVAACLLTFSPTALFVSQEAWDYSLVVLMVVLTAHRFFRAWTTKRAWHWVVFGGCAVLCFYVHVFNLLVIGSLYLVYGVTLLIPSRNRRAWAQRWGDAWAPFITGLVLFALLVPGVLMVVRTTGGEVAPESALIGAGPVTSFWDAFLTTLRHFAYDRPSSLYILGALFALSLPAAVKRPRSWAFMTVAVLCIGVPLLIALSKGIQFRVRHYSFALPFALMIMACGIVSVRRVIGLAMRRWRGRSTPAWWPALALTVLIMAGPAIPALEQYYRIRAPQSVLLSYEQQGLVEARLVTPPTKIQLYSKSKVPDYREIAALLRRCMQIGDVLILDPPIAGDDIGRGVLFQLNRCFGLDLPADPTWGTPVTTAYDALRFNVMLSAADDGYLAAVEKARLPQNGMRVFRVSQRYNLNEVSDAVGLTYTLVNLTVSRQWFKEGKTLGAYLRVHRNLALAEDRAEAGQSALDQRDVATAERLYRESLGIARNSHAAYGLAVILMEQKRPEEAEPLLAFAAPARNTRWDYWALLGKARMALNRPDAALSAYQRVEEFPNASPWAILDFAILSRDRQEYEQAHAAYLRVAEAAQEPGYAIDAARMLLLAKQADRSLEEALAVIAAHPDQSLAYVLAVQCCESLGRRYDGYGYLLKAQALRPYDPVIVGWCVQYHLTFGKLNDAQALLQTALERHPGHPELAPLQGKIGDYQLAAELSRQADALEKSGDHTGAQERYRESWQTFKTADAAYGLGMLLLSQGKAEDAVALLSFAADIRHDRWEEWQGLAKVQEKLGQLGAAIESYERATALPKASPWVWLDLAKAAEAKREWLTARTAYLELAQRQQNVGYRLDAAWMALAAGQAGTAIAETLAVVNQYPENGLAHLRLVRCFEWLHQRDKAYPHAVKAAALRPDDVSAQVLCAQYHASHHHPAEAAAVLRAALARRPGDPQLEAALKELRDATRAGATGETK